MQQKVKKFFCLQHKILLTFNTSCNDDILPKGLGDLGSDGGCSLGLAGAIRFAPTKITLKTKILTKFIIKIKGKFTIIGRQNRSWWCSWWWWCMSD